MTPSQPRLRIFAGPNGSGKSTIKDVLKDEWIGVYVNADDIEKGWRTTGRLDLAGFALKAAQNDLLERLTSFFRQSSLMQGAGLAELPSKMKVTGSSIELASEHVDSYVSSVMGDFVRHELLAAGTSFTFETVMSHHGKVDFMREAQAMGYRTYLYFVATEDPQINVDRVHLRVTQGGHSVPDAKIVERYTKSIALLASACEAADRAYIFDNSGEKHRFVAEVTGGETVTLQGGSVPRWLVESTLLKSSFYVDDPLDWE